MAPLKYATGQLCLLATYIVKLPLLKWRLLRSGATKDKFGEQLLPATPGRRRYVPAVSCGGRFCEEERQMGMLHIEQVNHAIAKMTARDAPNIWVP